MAHWLVALFATYAVIGGSVTLIGWFAKVPRLTDWANSGISMFGNTALAIVCLGLGLLLSLLKSRWSNLSSVLGVFVATLGGATFLQHLFGFDFGIDNLLLKHSWGNRATMVPGRMGPPASASFMILGITMLLLRGGPRARRIVPFLGISVLVISTLSLLGYILGANPLFAVPRLTGIAMQTASILFALALAFIASVPEYQPVRMLQEESAAGLLVRKSLPLIIALPIMLGWLRVRAQQAGWFDTPMGVALLVLTLVITFTVLMWRWATAVGRHEEAVRESRAHEQAHRKDLEVLIEATPAIVWITHDRDSKVIMGNRASAKFLKMPERENVSLTAPGNEAPKHFQIFRNGKLLSKDELPIQLAARTGKQFIGDELEIRFDNATSQFIFGNVVSLLDEQGQPRGSIGAFVDITELKRAEEVLKKGQEHLETKVQERTRELSLANEELIRSNRELEAFAYVASHDLQEPLRMVTSYVQLLQRSVKKGDYSSTDDYINISVDAVNRMRNLINDLLSYSQIRSKPLEFKAHSLEKILQTATENLQVLIKEGEAHITHDPLPTLEVDQYQILQLFQNLISNAVKFRRKEDIPSIHVSVRKEREWSTICVQDNGIGIEPEYHQKIFQLFQRLHSRETYEGTGIGLAICRLIVERHGGKIWVESQPGKGSTFCFTLKSMESA
jgi:signal transduction histidine kinase